MKVCMLIFQLDNMGGITNYIENLGLEFQRQGVECDLYQIRGLRPKRTINKEVEGARQSKAFPYLTMIQSSGYRFDIDHILGYMNEEELQHYYDVVNNYDKVIFTIPCVSVCNATFGNMEWVKLYDLKTKPYIISHDVHFYDRYPHLIYVKDKIEAVISVHRSTHNMFLKHSDMKTMESEIMYDSSRYTELFNDNYESRSGLLSAQNFKTWKHVDLFVRICSFITDCPRVLSGSGLVYSNMTSPDKTKPRFFWKETDNVPKEFIGRRIWDTAIEAGMDHKMYIEDHEEMLRYFQKCKLFIDLSHNKEMEEFGEHVNTTFFEACITGAVPVMFECHRKPGWIEPGENFLPLKWTEDYTYLSEKVKEYLNMPKEEYERIQRNNIRLIKKLNKEYIAKDIIRLMNGETNVGLSGKLEQGEGLSERVIEKAERLKDHFNGIRKMNV